MKHWMQLGVLAGFLSLGNGCMMHEMCGDHSAHSNEQSTAEPQKSKPTIDQDHQTDQHSHHSSTKRSKTLMILGGVGMGIMMALMIL